MKKGPARPLPHFLKPKHAPAWFLVHADVDAGVGASPDEVAIPQVWQQLAPVQVLDDHSQVPVAQSLHPDVRGLSGQVPRVGFAAYVGVFSISSPFTLI